MGHIFGTLGLAYLVGCGLATNACVVARGLVRATGQALQGNFGEAGVEAAAAVVAPAVMTFQAGANLVGDVVDQATGLIGGLLGNGHRNHEPDFEPRFEQESVTLPRNRVSGAIQ